jgi:hypothetical protein
VYNIVAQANPLINDESTVYVCTTAPGNSAVIGNPTPANANYTYLWTTTGTGTISNIAIAQPTVTRINSSIGTEPYTVKVSSSPTCFKTSTVSLSSRTCCTTAASTLKFPAFTKMSAVVNAINAICDTCVVPDKSLVKNFDNVINFNGPIVMDLTDKNVTFQNCDSLLFAEDAKLSIRDGNTFTLKNSKMDACTNKMWRGIEVVTAQEEVKILNGSSIQNATTGVAGTNNALITAKSSTFNKNRYHLKFTKYAGNYSEVKNTNNNEKGITGNLFTHSSGNLLAPYTTLDRTLYGIYFIDCIGSVLIGNKIPADSNRFENVTYAIQATNSGLNVFNNFFSNFEIGISSILSRNHVNYIINKNKLSSNYYFSATDAELNNKGTAIRIIATASITPDSISITNNTIDRCRQGIFMSKINGKPLTVNLNSNFGGEIKGNQITLYQPESGNQAQGNFTHKAMVLIDNTNIDVVGNLSRTNNTVIGLLSTSQIDRYFGIESTGQGIGTDFYDNSFSALGKMIYVKGNNDNLRLKCNDFTRGSRNYPGTTDSTGITAIELQGTTATLLAQGASSASAKNIWNNFSTSFDRARRTVLGVQIDYYRFATDPLQDPLNANLFLTINAPNDSCNSFQGMVINNQNEHGIDSDDLAKDGESPIDSLAIYQTVYDSTETVGDLYIDANNFLLALEAVELGLIDSAEVMNNFENTAVYQVYNLETAMADGDSLEIIQASIKLPRDVVGDNYKIVAFIVAKTTDWTAKDSADLHYVAYQRIDDGGPAVINARNMLGIYLEETDLPSKSNRRSKMVNDGTYISVSPNPNKGVFTIVTNMPVNSDVKIFDSLGQLVKQNKLTDSTNLLELGNLTNGLYHLTISDTNGKLKSTSFVISK